MKKPFDYQAETQDLKLARADHAVWRALNLFFLGALVCNLIALVFLPRAVWLLPVVSSTLAGSLLMALIHANEVRRAEARLERYRARARGNPEEFAVLDFISRSAPIFEDVLQAQGMGRFVRPLVGVGFIRRRGAWIDITPAGSRHVIKVHERMVSA